MSEDVSGDDRQVKVRGSKGNPRLERLVRLRTVTARTGQHDVGSDVLATLRLSEKVVQLEGSTNHLGRGAAVLAAVAIASLDLAGDFAEALRKALTTRAVVSFAAGCHRV